MKIDHNLVSKVPDVFFCRKIDACKNLLLIENNITADQNLQFIEEERVVESLFV